MKVTSVLVVLVSVNFAAAQFVSSYAPQPFIYPRPVGSSNNDNEENKRVSEAEGTLWNKGGFVTTALNDTEKYPEGRKPFWLINKEAIAAHIGLPPTGTTQSVKKPISVADRDGLKALVMNDGPKLVPRDDKYKFVASEDRPKSIEGVGGRMPEGTNDGIKFIVSEDKSVEGDGGRMSEGSNDGIKFIVSEDNHESLTIDDTSKSVAGDDKHKSTLSGSSSRPVSEYKSSESGTGVKIISGENNHKSVASKEGSKLSVRDDEHKSFANEDGKKIEEFYDSSESSSYEEE